MVAKFPDTTSRLAHVIQVCGYPSDAAFAAALGLPPQNLRNWRQRNSIGKDSMGKIRDTAGASMDWLDTGKGEPFPNGPIPYTGPALAGSDAMQRLADAEAEIDALTSVVATLIQALGRLAPAEAGAVAEALRKPVAKGVEPPEALRSLLRVAEDAAAYDVRGAGAGPRKKRR